MDVNWFFLGMHYVQKKLIRKIENLTLNIGYFLLFSNVYHLLDSMLAVNIYITKLYHGFMDLDKGSKALECILKEKLKNINVYTFWSS